MSKSRTTRLNRIYWRMKCRCYNKLDKSYKRYGARGIIICDAWISNYHAFEMWATNNGYADYLSIDRINNNGNYEPNNCRWTTAKEQARNKRPNHIISYAGKTQTLAAWADEVGLKHNTIINRIKRGWPIEKSLTTALLPNEKTNVARIKTQTGGF